jgi:phosphoribosyl 1,2-cyclic phosphodiesterase
MMARFGSSGQTYHIFMSHLHCDHMMGFPFFTPAYISGNHIIIHGCHPNMEEAFRRQHSAPGFPVDFSMLGARIEFDQMKPGETREVAGLRVTAKLQKHGGDSYGYRFEHNGKTVIYSTDSEHKLDNTAETASFIEFFRNADLVIFDAMYSLADAISVKDDWGHSSNIVGVELCQLAEAKRFCMFHHEPAHDDEKIARTLAETRRFEEITRQGPAVEVISAYDGLVITL